MLIFKVKIFPLCLGKLWKAKYILIWNLHTKVCVIFVIVPLCGTVMGFLILLPFALVRGLHAPCNSQT